MIYNSTKLDRELKAAGIPILGCDSDGGINFRPEATVAHRKKAAKVREAHDPTPDPSPHEQYALLITIDQKVEFIARQIGLIT